MSTFLAMFLPILGFILMPILMPLIGWAAGTVKDRIVGFGPPSSTAPADAA